VVNPGHRGQPRHAAVDPDRPAPPGGRERGVQQRQRHRHDHRRARALHRARGDQYGGIRGQRASGRRQREQGEPGGEDPGALSARPAGSQPSAVGAGDRGRGCLATAAAFTHGYHLALLITGLCLIAVALIAAFGRHDDQRRPQEAAADKPASPGNPVASSIAA
jgi:hypothetical protein